MLKIRELENYLDELDELIPKSKKEYLENLRIRRSIERQLHISIECVIDISLLLIKELHLKVPNDEDSIFDILKEKLSNSKKLKEMKGFRNILVHRYGDLENEKVYHFLINDIGDFKIFIQDVKKLLNIDSKAK